MEIDLAPQSPRTAMAEPCDAPPSYHPSQPRLHSTVTEIRNGSIMAPPSLHCARPNVAAYSSCVHSEITRLRLLAALASYERVHNEQTLGELTWTLELYRQFAPDLFAPPGGHAWSEADVRVLLDRVWRNAPQTDPHTGAPLPEPPARGSEPWAMRPLSPGAGVGRRGEKRAAPESEPAGRLCHARSTAHESRP